MHGSDLFERGRDLRDLGDGIWSALPAGVPSHPYDARAAAYDFIVGSRPYNRLVWGSSPATYAAFARRAVDSDEGPLLDAGCGSLVFTAQAYANTNRPVVLVDQSIGMLRAARARLQRHGVTLSERVTLVQCDLRDLPFRSSAFATVLCMGMLHLFENVGDVVSPLAKVAQTPGTLFFAGLVSETRVGRHYLRLLHAAGEVATPKTQRQVIEALDRLGVGLEQPVEYGREGSMAFMVLHRQRMGSTAP